MTLCWWYFSGSPCSSQVLCKLLSLLFGRSLLACCFVVVFGSSRLQIVFRHVFRRFIPNADPYDVRACPRFWLVDSVASGYVATWNDTGNVSHLNGLMSEFLDVNKAMMTFGFSRWSIGCGLATLCRRVSCVGWAGLVWPWPPDLATSRDPVLTSLWPVCV